MTTDITELAQRMKAAAEKATPGPWHLSNENKLIIRGEDGVWIAHAGYFDSPVEISDGEHIALANPANVLALVEALEKAQQRIDSQREYYDGVIADGGKRIAELESRTVKLPPCVDDLHGIGMVMSADAVVEALAAAGIKVEAE